MVTLSTEKSTRKRLLRVWRGMHERCRYPKHKSWEYYGGRGIRVDERWNTFPPFLRWMVENGWKPGLKIDRKDNDGNYSPDNCRLVTHETNCNNTRRSVSVDAMGEVKSPSQWSRDKRASVSHSTIQRRMAGGLEPEAAITKAAYEDVQRTLTAFGETKRICEWLKDPRCVVKLSTLCYRINETDMTPEEALSSPSGSMLGRQRKALRITAWGETKSIAEWARDDRARVGATTINQRIVAYGYEPERAISQPSFRKRK